MVANMYHTSNRNTRQCSKVTKATFVFVSHSASQILVILFLLHSLHPVLESFPMSCRPICMPYGLDSMSLQLSLGATSLTSRPRGSHQDHFSPTKR
jgi:hypothetical protein